ncbi:LacI family DNA-binding transcriptional regulator [Streptomyces sp. S3(2020)]|uniref:substrate-binding domain-containing protein n=1 Tax=Streptomyces sp. S3(2020) TaxID=2732044 RepID=UPI001487FDA8|nr:LacI family DNA-binding transcriptional regulator [Streptomyces sp. S3(2020)]NNN29123.1 LacI family DNA-binding transcriptional regulator [Streptomyces sp. S3(2020)]
MKDPRQALAAGRSDNVLFSMPHLPISASAGRFAAEFATALAEHGLTMVAHLTGFPCRSLVDVCASVDASAVVGLESFAPETTAALRRAGVATVLSLGDDASGPDQVVARLQADHLLSRGHCRIGFAPPAQRVPQHMPLARLRGVEDACAAAGLEPPSALTVEPVAADAARAVAEWRDRSVSAVAAYNDETALAVLAGLRTLGLTAPDDMAVIGVDDIPTAALAAPPLTTIAFDFSNAAYRLAQAVTATLRGEQPQEAKISYRPHVVERESA